MVTIIDYGDHVLFRDAAELAVGATDGPDVDIFKKDVYTISVEGENVVVKWIAPQGGAEPNQPAVNYVRILNLYYTGVTDPDNSPSAFASQADLAEYIRALFITTPRTEDIIVAASDKDTELTTGFARYWPAPYNLTLLEVILDVDTDYVPTGAAIIGDVEISGASIFSTRPQIEANESSSRTGVEGVIATTNVSEGTQLKLYLDQVGSTFGGAGIIFTFKVQRA